MEKVVTISVQLEGAVMPSITERTYKWARALTKRKGPPTGFIWHHAAAARSVASTIHKWHLARKWKGLGYHFVVRKTGMIERGRPEDTIGSHTMNVNSRIGICVEGNLQTGKMPAKQLESVIWLQAYLVDKYGDKPTTRHKDHTATACPGKNFPWPIPSPAKKPAPAKPAPAKPAPKPKPRPVTVPAYPGGGPFRNTPINRRRAHRTVRLWQQQMRKRGWRIEDDGKFGPESAAVLVAFQREKRKERFRDSEGKLISVDGALGPQSWYASFAARVT